MKGDAANRKFKKKYIFREGLVENNVMYDNIKKSNKQMTENDVKFVIKALLNHFFFSNLSNDEL